VVGLIGIRNNYFNMFEWLLKEMVSVETRRFYRVDGPLPDETRRALEKANVPVPPSYKTFILQFGNAEFYRKLDYYLVRVYAAPRIVEYKDLETLLHFEAGRT
jgi:hypothetical protein